MAVIDALLADLTVFALAIAIGYEVASKTPSARHTTLLSGTLAIHGIVLVGGILVLGRADTPWGWTLGSIAVFLGGVNVAGGFVGTDRVLHGWKKDPE
jgi:H+-translocating NAD(P) transhydrogenase subunit alpha